MNEVLIVVDMQNDFIDGSLGTKEAEAIVEHVVEAIDRFEGSVIATRDTHPESYLSSREGRFLPVEHCIKDSDGWQIRKEVEEALKKKDALIIDKPTFGSEKLVEVLKEMDRKQPIGTVTLLGLCTDICVVSNALLVEAAFPETDIKVLKDCCAGVTPDSHEAALTTMKMCQIEVL